MPQLDTVQLDTDHGSLFVHAEAMLAKYRHVLDGMEACAVSAAASRDLIRSIEREI